MAEEVVERLPSGFTREIPTLAVAGVGANAITTEAIKAEAVTPAKVNKELPGRRLVFQSGFVIPELTKTAKNYVMIPGEKVKEEAAEVFAFAEKPPTVYQYDEAGWKIGTKTANFKCQVQVYVAAVAPTSTFVFGLAQMEAVKGAEKTIELKITGGKVIAGTKITVTAPAKETVATSTSAAFTLTNGILVAPMVEVTTETVAKSIVSGQFFLYLTNE